MSKLNYWKVIILLSLLILPAASLAGCAGLSPAPPTPPSPPPSAKIQYLAHSTFLVTSGSGVRIIIDPYTVTASMTYAPIEETADIVTISHEHGDHNNLAAVKGNPEVVRASGTITAKGIEFRVVSTFHDNVQGTQRGQNRVVCFTLDGVRFCHLGDLGHRLTGEQLAQIGKVDVLFIPVGGNFTIDALLATQVADDIKPSIVIPMHYKTAKAGQNFTTVDDFLKGKQNIKRPGVSILEISREKLPAATEIVVLEHSK